MVAGSSEVDRPGAAVEGDLDGVLELPRDPVRTDEVPAGAAGDDRELDLEPGDPVRDLVDSAVAADGDEQVGLARRLAGEPGELAGPLGEQGVAAQPERGGPVGELGPTTPDRAVLGSGVDEKDAALNGRSR